MELMLLQSHLSPTEFTILKESTTRYKPSLIAISLCYFFKSYQQSNVTPFITYISCLIITMKFYSDVDVSQFTQRWSVKSHVPCHILANNESEILKMLHYQLRIEFADLLNIKMHSQSLTQELAKISILSI